MSLLQRQKWIVVIILLLGLNKALAIGFGSIKTYSFLNEPLNAEIELRGVDNYDINYLTARLAGPKDFVRADIPRPYFLTRLLFEVFRFEDKTYIFVYSRNAVKHPYLDFLIELSWPEGRMVKGYTILIDPPPSPEVLANREIPLFKRNASQVGRVRGFVDLATPPPVEIIEEDYIELPQEIIVADEDPIEVVQDLEVIEEVVEPEVGEIPEDFVENMATPEETSAPTTTGILDDLVASIDDLETQQEELVEIEQKVLKPVVDDEPPPEAIPPVSTTEPTPKVDLETNKTKYTKYAMELLLALIVVSIIVIVVGRIFKRTKLRVKNSAIDDFGLDEIDDDILIEDEIEDELSAEVVVEVSEELEALDYNDLESSDPLAIDETEDDIIFEEDDLPDDVLESLDMLANDKDEVLMKIDLVKKYIDAGDKVSAKEILDDISSVTDTDQQKQIQALKQELA